MSRRALIVLVAGALTVGAAVVAFLDVPYVSVLAALLAIALGSALLVWGAWRAYQAFLWKVGRRLAFSYFLIGVLPIPLVLLLLGAIAYILSGYFLGHLYRDSVQAVDAEMVAAVEERLAAVAARRGAWSPDDETAEPVAYALYRGGRRVAGDPLLPEAWPHWIAEHTAAMDLDDDRPSPTFFALPGAEPTLAAAAGGDDLGVAAVYLGDLGLELSRRCDVWVQLYGPAREDDAAGRVNVEVMGKEMALKTDPRRSPGGAAEFFAARAESDEGSRWLERQWDRPFLWWGEVPGPLLALDSGQPVADRFGVGLNAPPRSLERHLFSGRAELDVSVWSSLFVFGFLLFDVYAVAALMAGLMIFALTRAVNRLSRATEAVRSGDFSVRIPVRRRDQVGELQRSFNTMAENLEELVATATQKELLEKELAIARDLQKSLVPHDLPRSEGIELASLFEPSAAIGGDYFDILRLGDDRLAVVVADVSGHGLPTGLRMAMMKSALTILASEKRPVEEILARLDQVARIDDDGRFFVTATLAVLDFRDGSLDLTNAGHPPTYLVRGRTVREILLPGTPLGTLGSEWGRERVELATDDVLVWLSDGLIEASDDDDEPFGYHGVEGALHDLAARAAEEGRELTAAGVRDGLVAAVAAHTGDKAAEDDRTLVVLRYRR